MGKRGSSYWDKKQNDDYVGDLDDAGSIHAPPEPPPPPKPKKPKTDAFRPDGTTGIKHSRRKVI